ncbi:MAG: helix-turn-helix transcriptional regulator [Ignavibacteriaceae bacterium]|nr:helix-turn-helix transcriptional regulator [Ignavibacteriaceae bacterium]
MNEELNVGNILKLYRNRNKLYQKEVASILGISREYYSQLENNKASPSTSLLITICKITNTNLPFLLNEPVLDNDICLSCHELTGEDRELVNKMIDKMKVTP